MFSLFYEAKFWTLKNDIQIRDTDFGAFRYYDKKELIDCPYQEGKKAYSENRGTSYVIKNKRPLKLKENLKELEQLLFNHKIVFYEWKDDCILQLILSTGIIVNIGVSIHTGNVLKITFDKYLLGKLLSENITDVLFTKTHLLIAYNENQVTLINFTKPSTKFNTPEKLSKLEPKVQQVELSGPTGRRLDRKLSSNVTGELILTWWQSSRNEIYPWSPLVKDKDRANVHVYSIVGNKIDLLCYYRTEYDQINVSFSRIKSNIIWLVEQKVSKKGEVTVEYSRHQVHKNVLQKISITSIPLQTQVCCHSISPDEEKLILGCIDGSLILFDDGRGITRLVKTSFIPNLLSWHCDGGLIFAANERGQFQCFDIALSCVRAQLLSEDVTPSNLVDLGCYFKTQPTLIHSKWNKKPSATCFIDKDPPNDSLLLLIFEGGPLGVLSLIGGGGLQEVPDGLTPDSLVRQYLLWNQIEKAINLLLSLNWNTQGIMSHMSLQAIVNYIFRHPLTPEREIQLETALGSFHVPLRPLTRSTENEYGDQVHDMTRRFFFHLLRHESYEKAYRLAIDLNDSDLFVDLYHTAKMINDEEMAEAAHSKFDELICSSETSSQSECSHSSCSCSVSGSSTDLSSSEEESSNLPPLPQVPIKKSKNSKIPPLPDLNRHGKLRESAFFNRPTYLHSDSINTIPEERSSDFSFESETASTSFNDFYPSLLNNEPISPDFALPATQILTPEYPHHYETRTSFSETVKNYPVVFNAPRKIPELNMNVENDGVPSKQNALNVIEKLYDLPTEINRPKKTEESIYNRSLSFDNLDKTYFNKTLHPFDNLNFRLKSPQILKSNNLNATFESPPKSPYSAGKLGSFDNLLSGKPKGRFLNNGTRILSPKFGSESSNAFPLPRSFPKPSVSLSPHGNKYNHLNNPPPIQPLTKQALKTGNPSPTKQKVKFSDTVTQIMVPDISKMALDSDSSSPQTKFRRRNLKGINPAQELADSLPLCLGNENYLKDFSKPQDHQDEEENNGTIKVIHFGVV